MHRIDDMKQTLACIACFRPCLLFQTAVLEDETPLNVDMLLAASAGEEPLARVLGRPEWFHL